MSNNVGDDVVAALEEAEVASVEGSEHSDEEDGPVRRRRRAAIAASVLCLAGIAVGLICAYIFSVRKLYFFLLDI